MSISIMEERPPYIEFKVLTEEDRDQSIATGSHKTKDIDYVLIMPAGDSKLKVERKVSEWLDQLQQKIRQGMGNPQHLEYFRSAYRSWKETQEIPLDGTPIKAWPVASASQVQNILSANIRTVEDLAQANEDALAKIGMGARALKDKAISWLSAASGTGKIAEENAAMKVQIADLTIKVQTLIDMNRELLATSSGQMVKSNTGMKGNDEWEEKMLGNYAPREADAAESVKRKPGRPRITTNN